MGKIKAKDIVHVQAGLLNYIREVQEVTKDEETGEKIYIVNGHCYNKSELTKIKKSKK